MCLKCAWGKYVFFSARPRGDSDVGSVGTATYSKQSAVISSPRGNEVHATAINKDKFILYPQNQ